MERKILRVGAAAILCATVLRLYGRALPAIDQEKLVAAMVFVQTGRMLRKPEEAPPATEPAAVIQVQETAPETEPEPETAPTPMTLTDSMAQQVQLSNQAGYQVDLQELLRRPLEWDLRQEEPAVLILHTHGSESYVNTEGYQESSDYRTLDDRYNMISIGERLAQCLENAGIRVIHDRTTYDYPSYSGSYSQARGALQRHLEENPSICLVLDIHRDAMTDSSGQQMSYTRQTENGIAAQLMLVAGTDAGGLEFPNWQENLSLAVKLQLALEDACAGICRPVSLRTGRYNQDVFANMLLIEVGAAGNTRQEALLAAEILAQGIVALAQGTAYE